MRHKDNKAAIDDMKEYILEFDATEFIYSLVKDVGTHMFHIENAETRKEIVELVKDIQENDGDELVCIWLQGGELRYESMSEDEIIDTYESMKDFAGEKY